MHVLWHLMFLRGRFSMFFSNLQLLQDEFLDHEPGLSKACQQTLISSNPRTERIVQRTFKEMGLMCLKVPLGRRAGWFCVLHVGSWLNLKVVLHKRAPMVIAGIDLPPLTAARVDGSDCA